MKNSCFVLALSVALFFAAALPAEAKRVALVIGNSAYSHAKSLRNPANDAEDMAAALKKLGFSVTLKKNLTALGFAKTISEFATNLSGADVALFWYAGHGLQYQKNSFLMPVDGKLKNEFSVRMESIAVADVISQMETQAKVNLVFLDACRNNPLADALNRRLSSRGRAGQMSRGLGRIPSTTGDTLIVYAAAPGTVADDGGERNSPFAKAMLRHMKTSGLEIGVLLKRVRHDVKRATDGKQAPEWLSRLEREFRFKKGGDGQSGDNAARVAYQAAKGRKSRLQRVIRHFDGTIWADYARDDLKKLLGKKVASLPVGEGASKPAESKFPNEPLPIDIDVDPEVLELVETHPFFANAPEVRVAKLVTKASSQQSNGPTSEKITVRWLRRGITFEQKASSSTSYSTFVKKRFASRTSAQSISAANGLIDLGGLSNIKTTVRRSKSLWSKNNYITTTKSIDSFVGRIFPVKVGNRFSYRQVVETTVNPNDPQTFDYKGVSKTSCNITKKYKASYFHKQLTGKAYLARCYTNYTMTGSVQNLKQKNTYGVIFFDQLGYWLSVDHVNPRKRLTLKGTFTELKSFSLTSSSKLVSRSASFTSQGSWLVQIAAARSRKEALRRYARIKAKYPTLVTQTKPDIQRANLGSRGIYYRLRLGMLASKQEAQKLCASFRKRGLRSCLVRRR